MMRWLRQDRCQERRAAQSKLVIYPELMAALRSGFDAGGSPEQIAGRMRLERHPMRVSHETIYRYAYSKGGCAEKFYQHLPRHRRNCRPRGMRKQHSHQLLDKFAMKHRPEIIAEHEQFGHWECYLVMFRGEFGKVEYTGGGQVPKVISHINLCFGRSSGTDICITSSGMIWRVRCRRTNAAHGCPRSINAPQGGT